MIKLFKCRSCWYVFDDELLYSGQHQTCDCGDRYFQQVNPTIYQVTKYILFHRLRAIKRILQRERHVA